MREIKFRAWAHHHDLMLYSEIDDVTVKELAENGENSFYFMQFTGLKDFKGKEIYADDIVRTAENVIGTVVYHDQRAAFILNDINNYNDLLFHYLALEVVGNIHQNPELLEKLEQFKPVSNQ